MIEGNIIRDLVAADASAPPGVQVLDLSGKFIIPGLFNSHVHWQEWMGELYVNHGVTSVMALENVPKALRAKSQDAADLPRFFHSGGRPPFTESSSDADIRQAVRNWLLNEPDLAWFPQYNDRIARAYAIGGFSFSAIPTTRPARCAMESTSSSIFGASERPSCRLGSCVRFRKASL